MACCVADLNAFMLLIHQYIHCTLDTEAAQVVHKERTTVRCTGGGGDYNRS